MLIAVLSVTMVNLVFMWSGYPQGTFMTDAISFAILAWLCTWPRLFHIAIAVVIFVACSIATYMRWDEIMAWSTAGQIHFGMMWLIGAGMLTWPLTISYEVFMSEIDS
jgi:hypothetical protein